MWIILIAIINLSFASELVLPERPFLKKYLVTLYEKETEEKIFFVESNDRTIKIPQNLKGTYLLSVSTVDLWDREVQAQEKVEISFNPDTGEEESEIEDKTPLFDGRLALHNIDTEARFKNRLNTKSFRVLDLGGSFKTRKFIRNSRIFARLLNNVGGSGTYRALEISPYIEAHKSYFTLLYGISWMGNEVSISNKDKKIDLNMASTSLLLGAGARFQIFQKIFSAKVVSAFSNTRFRYSLSLDYFGSETSQKIMVPFLGIEHIENGDSKNFVSSESVLFGFKSYFF